MAGHVGHNHLPHHRSLRFVVAQKIASFLPDFFSKGKDTPPPSALMFEYAHVDIVYFLPVLN